MLDKVRAFLKWIHSAADSDAVPERAVASGVWSAVINAADRTLKLASVVILARLLSPQAFGLLGICLFAIAAFESLNIGVKEALIQDTDQDIDHLLDTAWILQSARGIAISVVLVAGSGFVGQVFNEPQVVNPLRALALLPFLRGIRNPGALYFQKDLRFDKEFIYQMSNVIPFVTISIGTALFFRSVWALVLGYVAGTTIKTAASYVLHEYRPSLSLNKQQSRKILSYGKWISGSSVFLFLNGQGDDGFIGFALGASALGIYQLAYRLSNAPATEVSQVFRRVLFPTYSKQQNDKDRLRRTYLQSLTIISTIAIPVGTGIAVVGPIFVPVVLGKDWLGMILPIQFLAVFGIIRAVSGIDGPLLLATGRPDIPTKAQGLHTILLVGLLIPTTFRYGLPGASAAVTASLFIPWILKAVATQRMVDGSMWSYARHLVPATASAGIMYLVVRLVREAFPPTWDLLAACIVTGILVYILMLLLLAEFIEIEILNLLSEFRALVS